jgi:hypothetical protein
VDSLDSSLTINGTAVTPEFRYKGGDADGTDWAPWGYGETLALQAGTAPSYNQGSPLYGVNDDSVKFNGGGYYQADNNTFGDVSTNDIVLEMIFKVPAGANEIAISKRDGTNAGWQLYSASGYLLFLLKDSDSASVNVQTLQLCVGCWYHLLVFINRDEASDNGSRIYVNGVQSYIGADFSSAAASANYATSFKIGAHGAGGRFSREIAYAAMWQQADWHQAGADGPAEWAIIAKERFARLTGMYASAANPVPSVATRSTSAYLDKNVAGVRKLYNVGANWMRTVERLDSASASIRGYLPEPEATNLCLQSQDIDNTGFWSPIRATVSVNAVTAPDGTLTADAVHEDSTAANTHYVLQGSLGVTSGSVYTTSVFAKAANRTWVNVKNSADLPGSIYVNLSNGTAGATDSLDSYKIEDYGDGWYRISITVLATATGTNIVRIFAAEADNDQIFDGLDHDSIYLWGVQFELGNLATSYIPTTTAAVTRTADILGYTFVGPDKGTVLSTILSPNYINADYPFIFDLNDTTNRIRSYLTPTTGVVGFAVGGTAAIAGTTDLSNGAIHELRCFFSPALSRLYIDGTKEGDDDTDTTVTAITNLKVGIDMANTAGRQLNGVIAGVSVLKKLVSP